MTDLRAAEPMELDAEADKQAPRSSQTAPSQTDEDGATEWSRRKTEDILEACKWRNINALTSLAETKDGFLTDSLRKKAWPILLGSLVEVPGVDNVSDEKTTAASEDDGSWKELPRHKDEDQVQLDVNRSFIYYPNHESDAELESNKRELSDLITEVLRRHPYLCYFQGYHDICQVFLLVLDPPWRARLVSRLSVLRIRDFMLTNLEPTISQVRLIHDILNAADPKLRRHLVGVEPFYALAGTLTMYSHDIQGYVDIARLFDILLSREPVFSIYMFAQIVLSRRDQLLDEDDPSMLHYILSKVPPQMDLETVIADSIKLFERFPPQSLPLWRKISPVSCLNTARSVEDCSKQTLEQGHEYFRKQQHELWSLERRQKIMKTVWLYRRQAGMVGLAVVVGLIAMYLRRSSGPVSQLAALYSRWSNSTHS